MSEDKRTIIEATGLSVDFWVDGEWIMAASGVNFSVGRGEVLAIVGESGSGKSTSAMSLLGLLPVNGRSAGSVKLRGEELVGGGQSAPETNSGKGNRGDFSRTNDRPKSRLHDWFSNCRGNSSS